jgi:multiple antibiotic resistance protein
METALAASALTFGLQAFVTLFVILDPPGATPVFLALVAGKTQKVMIRLAWQAASVSLFVIVIFALFGNYLLNYLQISFPALQGAGGILLLINALGLLTGSNDPNPKTRGDGSDRYIALVPLGTPLLAGPGAIVSTMLFVKNAENWEQTTALAVHLVIGLTLMFSTKIMALIKEAGVTLVARIAGLLLAAIAVEMIVTSVKGFFNL